MILANKWLDYRGIEFLEEAGIKEGDTVFDCFCGEGNYTIPAARVVKSRGVVHAMDRDSYKTATLRKRASKAGLKNIKILEEEFTGVLPFRDSSIDAVLLYDIFWYYSPGDRDLALLLGELHRILKDDGLLSVYPEHIDSERLITSIKTQGFNLVKEFNSTLMHDNSLKKGHILNFIKIVVNTTFR